MVWLDDSLQRCISLYQGEKTAFQYFMINTLSISPHVKGGASPNRGIMGIYRVRCELEAVSREAENTKFFQCDFKTDIYILI